MMRGVILPLVRTETMNNEERDVISRFVARVGGAQAGASGQQTPALPPIDPEADQFIAQQFQQYPEARYRVTQLAVVQEAALAQAQNRIRQLEFQLQQAQAQASKPSGGFLGGLFGGGARPQQSSPPPGWGAQPGYAPQQGYPQAAYPQGVAPASAFGRGGSGFLGSALTTAAGVAGGMMAANALEGLFSGHESGGGFGAPGSETVINNYYGDSDPFGGAGQDAGGGFSDSDFGGDSGGFDDSSF